MAHKKELEALKWKRIRIKTSRRKDLWWSVCKSRQHNCKTKGNSPQSRHQCLYWKRSYFTRKN